MGFVDMDLDIGSERTRELDEQSRVERRHKGEQCAHGPARASA